MTHPADLVAGTSDGIVLDAPPREFTRREFLHTVWKTANYLRSIGVHGDSLVAITDDPTPESILALFGASLLDAPVRFDPPADVDARVIVAPTADLGRFELPPGGQYVGYGERPENPAWSYFEREVWSETPAFPDVVHPADATLIDTGDGTHTTTALVEAATAVAADLTPDDRVVVRAPLATPETVAAGILAPLVANATIILPDAETTGTVAVAPASSDVPESRTIDPAGVDLGPPHR